MTAHAWLSSSGQFDVCSRKGCYWQRRRPAPQGLSAAPQVHDGTVREYLGIDRGQARLDEYRTARTDWRPIAEPPCPGSEKVTEGSR
jgi:hypothetical protein